MSLRVLILLVLLFNYVDEDASQWQGQCLLEKHEEYKGVAQESHGHHQDVQTGHGGVGSWRGRIRAQPH